MMTKAKGFPINYIVSMSSLRRIFDDRKRFRWWQLIFLFLFINGCLMMPISVHLSSATQAPLSLIAPRIDQSIKRAVDLDGTIKAGTLIHATETKRNFDRQTIVATDPENMFKVSGNPYHQTINGYKNALIFQKNRLILTDQNGYGFVISYPKHKTFSLADDRDNVKGLAAELWMDQFKPIYVAVVSLISFAALLISNLILMSVIAVILWITKYTKISDIQSLRESCTIVMTAAGWPSLAALFLSLFSFDYGLLMMVQTVGLVLVLSLVFWRTHFQNDRRVTRRHLTVLGDESK